VKQATKSVRNVTSSVRHPLYEFEIPNNCSQRSDVLIFSGFKSTNGTGVASLLLSVAFSVALATSSSIIKASNTMMTVFSSSKQAVEGFPMIPNSNVLFGHLLLMRDPDFRVVINKFSVEHADSHGRCCFWMGTTPALSVTAPEDVQLILKQSSHRTTFSLLQRHLERFLGENSIGILSGREWKKQRSAISKALHTAVSSDSYGMAVVKATQGLVDALLLNQEQQQRDSAASEQAQQQHYELGEIMKLLTLDIFGQTAMHADFGCCHNHWHPSSQLQLPTSPNPIAEAFDFLASEMMRRMTTGILDPASQIYSIPTPSNRKQAEQSEFLRGYIVNSIEQRRHELAVSAVDCPDDLLTAMIQVKDLSKEELTDTLLSLLFAGYETTAATLAYAIYLISQHVSVEQQCLEEIEQQVCQDSGTIKKNPEDYPYLQAVLMETLRLYPPAISTTRSLEKELILDGIPVPKGTYLYIPIWTIQRDSKNFPEPLAFRPERWAVPVSQQQQLSTDGGGGGGGSWQLRDPLPELGNAQAWVPFSAGARSCVGQRFAIHEMTLALAVLVHDLEFRLLDPDYEVIPYRSGIVQTPKDGLPMTISKRSH
jgi:cytochrome P450